MGSLRSSRPNAKIRHGRFSDGLVVGRPKSFKSGLGDEQNSAAARHRSHLRTSSAVARNVGGIVTPIAAAVLALIESSNLVGCSTGISPGFVPRRILSTISAAFRNRSG